jgi:hypothetical protein
MQYAQTHQSQFPPHEFVTEIPAKVWQAPDSAGTRYVYMSGLTLSQSNSVVACEPIIFGKERLVLFASGKIQKLTQDELYGLLGVKKP